MVRIDDIVVDVQDGAGSANASSQAMRARLASDRRIGEDARMLRRFLVAWVCNVAALWVAAKLLDGVHVGGDRTWVTFVVAGLVFSLVNLFVKPLVTLLAIPLIILTLGIAYFLVNVGMVFLTSAIVDDFHVDGFWTGVDGDDRRERQLDGTHVTKSPFSSTGSRDALGVVTRERHRR